MCSRYVPYLSKEREDELKRIANAIVAPGKGILAADESTGDILNHRYFILNIIAKQFINSHWLKICITLLEYICHILYAIESF